MVDTFENALAVYSRSQSYRLFYHTIYRTRELLKWASTGLTTAQQLPEQILTKLERAKAGEPEPEDSADLSDTIEVTLSAEDIQTIQFALTAAQRLIYDRLHFHLHELMLMAVWSSFESYLQGIIAEVYTQTPSALAVSEKQVAYRDLVPNAGSLLPYLIQREIKDFGRLSLSDRKKYIKNRIKYDFHDDEKAVLVEMYFLRNVAAHNSGFIRQSQQALVPNTVGVRNNQIEIPREYLETTLTAIEALVVRMDSSVVQRWNVPQSSGALFEDLPTISNVTA